MIERSDRLLKKSNDEDFITLDDIRGSKLAEILCEVIHSEQLPTEYISQQNEKEMKVSTFKHPTAKAAIGYITILVNSHIKHY